MPQKGAYHENQESMSCACSNLNPQRLRVSRWQSQTLNLHHFNGQ